MRELSLLGPEHAGMLSAFVLSQPTSFPQLHAQAAYFTGGHKGAHVIGVINIAEQRLEEALITFYHNRHAVTIPLTNVSSYRSEAFDMLCAGCSSATPVVEKHVTIVPARSLHWFEKAWTASRLGKYTLTKRFLTPTEVTATLGGKAGLVKIDQHVRPFLFQLRYPV